MIYFSKNVPIPLFLGFMLCVCAVTAVADWPQMAGPNRNNISDETGIARSWPENGPNVLWTVSLGEGFASPSIKDGKVYILDRPDAEMDVLRCFDLETGEELWNFPYAAPGKVSYEGSRTAPTIEGNRIYFVGVLGHFHCLDLETHMPMWKKHIREDFGEETPNWGVAQAPSIYNDLVIVAPQTKEAGVVAYNKDSGELVWKTPMLGSLGYSTPVITTLCGVDQAVMITAGDVGATGISLEDGSVLWQYENWYCKIPIPYATTLPDDRLFITGGYGAGSAMIQLLLVDGTFSVTELFKTDECGSQIQQPILFEDHLYVNSNSNEREDGLMCLTLDGEVLWKTRDTTLKWFATTFERGPLLLADSLLFELDGKKGNLHLIEPSPKEYRELAQVKILSGKQIWAPMALSQGKLVLRSQSEMKCVDVKNP